MRGPRVRGAGLLLLLLLLCGAVCTPSPMPPPEIEYAGCRAVLMPGPLCVLDAKRELRLWVGAPPGGRIEIRVDDNTVDVRGEPVREGRRFVLRLPGAARTVAVRAARRPAWLLSVAGPENEQPPGSRDVLGEARRQGQAIDRFIRDRDLAAVRESLDGIQMPPQPVAQARYIARYYRGMLAEREGDYRSALREMNDAIEIAERVKEDRYHWLAEEELALILRGVGRSHEAAQLFERLRRRPEGVRACEKAQLLHNQAWSELLAREAGESTADPTPLLEEALPTYESCKWPDPERKVNIRINLALAHLQQGRLAETKRLLSRAHDLEPHPTLDLQLWSRDLEGRIALAEHRPEAALRSFAELGDLAAQTSSFDGRLRAFFGQARSHQALGRPAAALETLLAAERLLDEQSLQIPIHEGREFFVATRTSIVGLHIELLLDQGRTAEALVAARRARSRILRQLAQADRLADLSQDQQALRSRLLTDYQRRRAALQLRARDEWKLPIDQRAHEEAVRRTEAEAAKKVLDEAFLVLGEPGSRRREALSPPRPGELVLAYHPLAGGWVGFAAEGETVVAHRFDLPPDLFSRPGELAERLLVPFRAAIERAKRIRVLPSGRLEQVDFHALPFGGAALLAGRPVVYGLDLAAATHPTSAPGRQALLVTDPRRDLPGAVAEARAVRGRLQSVSRRWSVKELRGTEASATAVLAQLAGVDLLHYAGHGTFSGFGGWDSSLLLADSTLTMGDLLALKALPASVVLSGCDTGRSAAETPVAGLGLAHALLLAGSRGVVASTRPADDRALPAFFADLYRQWDGEPDDLARALQGAQLAWRGRNPRADWASFRLFEP